MAEYGLVLIFVVAFGLPVAFSFGVMWAKTGREEQ